MRILVVEDEKKLGGFIKRALREDAHAVDVAHDGEEGGHLAMLENCDAIVLDLGLPGRDELSILRELRERNNRIPVLIVTARDSTKEKVQGLDAGADEYMTPQGDPRQERTRPHPGGLSSSFGGWAEKARPSS